MASAAASLGVGLRRFPGRPGLESAVRITVPGDEDDFDRLVSTLGSVFDPQAIIFDLDGVIADVSGSQVLAIIETARSFGVEIEPSDIEAAKGDGNSNDDWELTRRLCRGGVDAPIEEVTDRFETLYQGTEGLAWAQDGGASPWSINLNLAALGGQRSSGRGQPGDRDPMRS